MSKAIIVCIYMYMCLCKPVHVTYVYLSHNLSHPPPRLPHSNSPSREDHIATNILKPVYKIYKKRKKYITTFLPI